MEPLNTDRVELLALVFCLLLFAFLGRLVMRRRLREEYIVVWGAVLGLLVFFAVFRSRLDALARLTGIYYAPSLLFLFVFGGLLFYCLHLSVVASKQSEQIKELAQKMALLESELRNREIEEPRN